MKKDNGSVYISSQKFCLNQKQVILAKPKILPGIYKNIRVMISALQLKTLKNEAKQR